MIAPSQILASPTFYSFHVHFHEVSAYNDNLGRILMVSAFHILGAGQGTQHPVSKARPWGHSDHQPHTPVVKTPVIFGLKYLFNLINIYVMQIH